MSTIYDKTDNYSLNLYGDNDPADLRDGYNGSMRTIDDTLEKHLNRIESIESRETHDEEVIKALIGDNTVDNAATAKAKWDKASIDAIEATATANAAASKADGNTQALTALGVETAEKAEKFAHEITSNCNVVLHGIPNDASYSVSDLINAYIKDNPFNGVYFPAGTYHLDKTIDIPKNTTNPFTFYAEPNAKFVATANMTNMFDFGAYSGNGEKTYGATIAGGVYDCAGLCDNCWSFEQDVYGVSVSNMTIKGAKVASFYAKRAQALDMLFTDIRINTLKESAESQYGFYLNGTDCQFVNVYTTYCHTHFKCNGGGMMFDTIHSFNNPSIQNAVCYDLANGVYFGNNIYIDTIAIGVKSKYIDAYFTNVYHFAYTKLDTDTMTFKVSYNARLRCDGLYARFLEDSHAATPLVGVKDDQYTFNFENVKFSNVDTYGDNCLMPVMPNYGKSSYHSSLFYGVTDSSNGYIPIGVLYEEMSQSISVFTSKSLEPYGEVTIEIDNLSNIYVRSMTFSENSIKYSLNGFLYDKNSCFPICVSDSKTNKLGLPYRVIYLKNTTTLNKSYKNIIIHPNRTGITFFAKGGIATEPPIIAVQTTPVIKTITAQ